MKYLPSMSKDSSGDVTSNHQRVFSRSYATSSTSCSGVHSGVTERDYRRLSRVAPTVAQPGE